jgi:LPS export ABC transporter protein LptC
MAAPACAADGAKPTAIVSVVDSADQVLYGFKHYVTRDGVRESEMEADTAYFYDPSQTTVLRNMRLVFIDSSGAPRATITSRTGRYQWQQGGLVAESSVVLKTPDGKVLKSERLVFDSEKNAMSSDLPFTFDNKGEHIEGQGFVSDMSFGNIVAKSPRGRTTEGMLLPGQDEADEVEKADSVAGAVAP